MLVDNRSESLEEQFNFYQEFAKPKLVQNIVFKDTSIEDIFLKEIPTKLHGSNNADVFQRCSDGILLVYRDKLCNAYHIIQQQGNDVLYTIYQESI